VGAGEFARGVQSVPRSAAGWVFRLFTQYELIAEHEQKLGFKTGIEMVS
jgi:hypothetical protein